MSSQINTSTGGSNLGEVLERILDKGVVIAGDISVSLANVELLTIRIRLVVASVDKAAEMGIDWWKSDPYLNSKAKKEKDDEMARQLGEKNQQLLSRIEELEGKIDSKLESKIEKRVERKIKTNYEY